MDWRVKISRFCIVFLIIIIGSWIAVNSIRHLTPYDNPSMFLRGKEAVYSLYIPALYAHIFTSPLILFLGLLGFNTWIRKKKIALHRILGKIYVCLILAFSAPAGLIMAIYAKGGWQVQSCFILLSILWWFFTYRAWSTIQKGDIQAHRRFMLRSYVLTISAVMLRLYAFVFIYYFHWQGLEAYTWAAWLSWLPNWLMIEVFLRKSKKIE